MWQGPQYSDGATTTTTSSTPPPTRHHHHQHHQQGEWQLDSVPGAPLPAAGPQPRSRQRGVERLQQEAPSSSSSSSRDWAQQVEEGRAGAAAAAAGGGCDVTPGATNKRYWPPHFTSDVSMCFRKVSHEFAATFFCCFLLFFFSYFVPMFRETRVK